MERVEHVQRTHSRDTSAAIIDGLIKFVAGGGMLASALVAPNAVQGLDKPLQKLFRHLDARQRDRELRRLVYYMKSHDLISYDANDYEHGVRLTAAGKERLRHVEYGDLSIPRPAEWDSRWRLVFFDIPETHKTKRNAFNLKLKQLGFKKLQISIWVHPHPSRAEIEAVCETLGIRRYVTYLEVSHIDNARQLQERFTHLLK